jgi:hypothetical protein
MLNLNVIPFMETTGKIKLSSDHIFYKILFSVALLYCLIQLMSGGEQNYLYFIAMIPFLLLLIMVSVRPDVYYDEASLYIKKFNEQEKAVPLDAIDSVSAVMVRVGAGYLIKYLNESKLPESVLVYIGLQDIFSTFIDHLTKVNPNVKFQTSKITNYL